MSEIIENEDLDEQGNNVTPTDGNDSEDQGKGEDENQSKEGKLFTQKELDKIVKDRLVRERKKLEKKENSPEKDGNVEVDKKTDGKINDLELKLLCFENGVNKESLTDVIALSKAYQNDDVDQSEAIEKVLEKYPNFKGDSKPMAWGGEHGKGTPGKLSEVEQHFYRRNPILRD